MQADHRNLVVPDTPGRVVAIGLDGAIRADGHTEIASDCVNQCVEKLERSGPTRSTGDDGGGGLVVSMTRLTHGFWWPLTVFVATAMFAGVVYGLLPARGESTASSDYVAYYEPVARRILQGHGFTVPDGGLAARYPPGFSLILAGLFATEAFFGLPARTLLPVFLSMCLGAAATLVFLISARVFSERKALIAPALFATYPLVLQLVRQPSSDLPFLPPIYGAVFLFVLAVERHWSPAAFVCGIMVGIAVLIRPIAIGLGILLAVLILVICRAVPMNTRVGLALLILAGNLLTVLPWELYLYRKTGKVIYMSTGGKKSIRDGLAFAGSRKSFRGPLAVPQGVSDIERDVEAEWERTGLKTSRDVRALMLAELHRRPLAVAELVAVKAARSFYATDSRRNEGLIVALQVVYLTLFAYAGARMWRVRGLGSDVALVTGAVVGYFWLMTILVLSIVRYMVPALGLAFVLLPAVFVSRTAEA